MKNNKGFGKFEVLTMIVVLLCIFAFLAYRFLGGTSLKKLDTMKDSATNLAKTVIVNKESFRNPRQVFLGEVLDEQLLKDIKNPVGEGVCSHEDSFVQLEDHNNYVTLKCGEYLLDRVDVKNVKTATIYQVTEWSTTKAGDTDEERVFYNCKENGTKVFEKDYEENYFVYQINKKYGTAYYFAESAGKSCEVVKTTMYRTKTEVTK